MEQKSFEDMLGKTMKLVVVDEDEETVVLMAVDGEKYRFFEDIHSGVRMDGVSGDLSNLVGSPLLVADERVESSSVRIQGLHEEWEFRTWTFHEFATAKGSVTVRWSSHTDGGCTGVVSRARYSSARHSSWCPTCSTTSSSGNRTTRAEIDEE